MTMNQVPIYFCDGNHEDHRSLRKLSANSGKQPLNVGPNVFYMPRGSILCLPDGRKVLFMGGAQSIDKSRRTPGYDWFEQELIQPQDLLNLPEVKIDIVISHACPLEFQIVPENYLDLFSNDPCRGMLSEILHKYKPALWYSDIFIVI
jgi:DNA repair exonuclease SbcCD nuclease subunit